VFHDDGENDLGTEEDADDILVTASS